jgi:hypothetical protein
MSAVTDCNPEADIRFSTVSRLRSTHYRHSRRSAFVLSCLVSEGHNGRDLPALLFVSVFASEPNIRVPEISRRRRAK